MRLLQHWGTDLFQNAYEEKPSVKSLITGLMLVVAKVVPRSLKSYLLFLLAQDFQSAISKRSMKISGGAVARGQLQGTSLPGSGLSSGQIWGFWEKPVQDFIQSNGPFGTCVDIGAADGIYPIGLLRNQAVQSAICYEALELSRAKLASNADSNAVRVDIRGIFGPGELEKLKGEVDESHCAIIIVDIEGGEYELLSRAVLEWAAKIQAHLIVELHPTADKTLEATLIANLNELFHVEQVSVGGRPIEPELCSRLGISSELEWWLAMWEARQSPQVWICAKPSLTPHG